MYSFTSLVKFINYTHYIYTHIYVNEYLNLYCKGRLKNKERLSQYLLFVTTVREVRNFYKFHEEFL